MNSWKRGWQAILLGALLLGSSWAEAAPIEMQVVEGDVRSVLLSLARTAHENIVLDDSVAGTVTLHVTEEPAKLLRMIAASKGLVLVKEGSTYLVTTMPRADALRSVHVYPVRHADPADLARAAELSLRSAAGDKTADGQEAGTARRVLVDSATNSVLFYGTAAEAANVAKVVQQLDCKPRQVSLEAKVLALSKDASKKLGVEWQWSSLPQYPDFETTYRHKGSANEVQEKEIKRHTQDGTVPGIIQFGRGPEGRAIRVLLQRDNPGTRDARQGQDARAAEYHDSAGQGGAHQHRRRGARADAVRDEQHDDDDVHLPASRHHPALHAAHP